MRIILKKAIKCKLLNGRKVKLEILNIDKKNAVLTANTEDELSELRISSSLKTNGDEKIVIVKDNRRLNEITEKLEEQGILTNTGEKMMKWGEDYRVYAVNRFTHSNVS